MVRTASYTPSPAHSQMPQPRTSPLPSRKCSAAVQTSHQYHKASFPTLRFCYQPSTSHYQNGSSGLALAAQFIHLAQDSSIPAGKVRPSPRRRNYGVCSRDGWGQRSLGALVKCHAIIMSSTSNVTFGETNDCEGGEIDSANACCVYLLARWPLVYGFGGISSPLGYLSVA